MTVAAVHPVALGAASYALVVVAPLAVFLLITRLVRGASALVERRAARRGTPSPGGRPIEHLARDLRRLRAEIVAEAHPSQVRRVAVLIAYDDVLRATCERLGLPHGLDGSAAAGDHDRELERLRAEAAIERAGVPLTRGSP